MKRKRRRLSKKELERLERELAQREANARSESEDRRDKIKILWGVDEQQFKATKSYKEKKDIERKLIARKLEELLKTVGKLAEDDMIIDRVGELVELAGLQYREIEYLDQFRRELERIRAYDPQKLEHLANASVMLPLLDTLPKRKPNWEDKRHGHKLPGGVGLIEYEFGGAAEAYRRKHSLLPGQLASSYEPTCLDNIFAGDTVRMRSEDVALNPQPSGALAPFLSKTRHKAGLEELFGLERHRFGKGLPSIEKGRERSYDYCAVVKIMRRLLSEEPREDKRPRRGKTPRLWPSNPALRIPILIGIHQRMERISMSEDIWGAFTAVVCLHLAKGLKDRLSEGVTDALAALVRRHLPDSGK